MRTALATAAMLLIAVAAAASAAPLPGVGTPQPAADVCIVGDPTNGICAEESGCLLIVLGLDLVCNP